MHRSPDFTVQVHFQKDNALDVRHHHEVRRIYGYIARYPLAPCYGSSALFTVTCECFPIGHKHSCKHLGPEEVPGSTQRLSKKLFLDLIQ